MSGSKKEKSLPKPPHAAFGRRKPAEQRDEEGPLLADRLAAAMAEGTVDDFMKRELPDNEYARSLTSLMMGMTGMLPAGGETPPTSGKAEQTAPQENPAPAQEVPDDIRSAVQGGDVQGLVELLRREHRKRTPECGQAEAKGHAAPEPPQGPGMPAFDKDLIDSLIRIAQDNSVTLDWIILRAIKVYVHEYRKTGRL